MLEYDIMKLGLVLLLSSLLALPISADSVGDYEGSAEFERLKSLVGSWTGKTKMDPEAPEMEITVEYRLVAGGSAIEERTFAGTPKEMVTMYHDKRGKLALTHFCMLHNQPAMLLTASDDKSISLDFDPSCEVNPKKDTHMHSLVITFVDANTLTQKWTLYTDGKSSGEHPITLKRVKKK